MLLPITPKLFSAPSDRDMSPSERRLIVRTHRTCVLGYPRLDDGPATSVVYYVPTDEDELLVSTMAGAKARAVVRNPKISLCVLDERWPFVYLQVYADAAIDRNWDLAVDVLMAVAGRMSGEPAGEDTRPFFESMAEQDSTSCCAAVPTRPSPRPDRSRPRTSQSSEVSPAPCPGVRLTRADQWPRWSNRRAFAL